MKNVEKSIFMMLDKFRIRILLLFLIKFLVYRVQTYFVDETSTALALAQARTLQRPKAPFTDKISPLSFDVTLVAVRLHFRTENSKIQPGPS